MRKNPSKNKIVSAIVIMSFLITTVYPPSNLSAEVAPEKPAMFTAFNNKINVPQELGKIVEVYGENRTQKSPTIIYIQDAHDSLEAQENIAKLIEHFVAQNNVKTVFEEGYEGEVPIDKYFPENEDPGLRQKVAYFLLDNLRVGGAEYARITRPKNETWKLIGADSLELHRSNVEQYQITAKKEEETKRDFSTLKKELQNLSSNRFPKQFKDWLKTKTLFDSKKIDFFTYFKRSFPLADEKILSPILQFIHEVINTKDQAIIEKAKHIDPRELFVSIDEMGENIARNLLENDTDKEIYEVLKMIMLLERLMALEVTQDEYQALKMQIETFNTDRVADFIYAQTKHPLVLSRKWEKNIQDAIRFYQIAGKRDEAISKTLDEYFPSSHVNDSSSHSATRSSSQNSERMDSAIPLRSMQNDNALVFAAKADEVAVLVYGGFHKENIKRILESKGLSYCVVMPKISGISSRHTKIYKKLMSDGQLPFEKNILDSVSEGTPPLRICELPEGKGIDYVTAVTNSFREGKDPEAAVREKTEVDRYNPFDQLIERLTGDINRAEIRGQTREQERYLNRTTFQIRWFDNVSKSAKTVFTVFAAVIGFFVAAILQTPRSSSALLENSKLEQVYAATLEGMYQLRRNDMPINQVTSGVVPRRAWLKSADIGFQLTSDLLALVNHDKHKVVGISNPEFSKERIKKTLERMTSMLDEFELKVALPDGAKHGTGILPETILNDSDRGLNRELKTIPHQNGKQGYVYAFYDMALTHFRIKLVRDVFRGGIVDGVEDSEIADLADNILRRTDYRAFIDGNKKIHAQVFEIDTTGEIIQSPLIVDNKHTEIRIIPAIAELLGTPGKSYEERYAEGLESWNAMKYFPNRIFDIGTNQVFVMRGDHALSLWTEAEGRQFFDFKEIAPDTVGKSFENYIAVLKNLKTKHKLNWLPATTVGTSSNPEIFSEFGIADAPNLPSVIVPAGQFAVLMDGEEATRRDVARFVKKASKTGAFSPMGFVDSVDTRTAEPLHEKQVYINLGLAVEYLNNMELRDIVGKTAWGKRAIEQYKKEDFPAGIARSESRISDSTSYLLIELEALLRDKRNFDVDEILSRVARTKENWLEITAILSNWIDTEADETIKARTFLVAAHIADEYLWDVRRTEMYEEAAREVLKNIGWKNLIAADENLFARQIAQNRLDLIKELARPNAVIARSETRANYAEAIEGLEVIRGGKYYGAFEEGDIAITDEQGNLTQERMSKEDAHKNQKWHMTSHVYLFYNGKLLLQKRSLLKDASPGKLQVSASGHIDFPKNATVPETPIQAAVREMKEETGLDISPQNRSFYQITPPNAFARQDTKERTTIFAYFLTDGDLEQLRENYNLDENELFVLMSFDEFKKRIGQFPDAFSSSLVELAKGQGEILKYLKELSNTRERAQMGEVETHLLDPRELTKDEMVRGISAGGLNEGDFFVLKNYDKGSLPFKLKGVPDDRFLRLTLDGKSVGAEDFVFRAVKEKTLGLVVHIYPARLENAPEKFLNTVTYLAGRGEWIHLGTHQIFNARKGILKEEDLGGTPYIAEAKIFTDGTFLLNEHGEKNKFQVPSTVMNIYQKKYQKELGEKGIAGERVVIKAEMNERLGLVTNVYLEREYLNFHKGFSRTLFPLATYADSEPHNLALIDVQDYMEGKTVTVPPELEGQAVIAHVSLGTGASKRKNKVLAEEDVVELNKQNYLLTMSLAKKQFALGTLLSAQKKLAELKTTAPVAVGLSTHTFYGTYLRAWDIETGETLATYYKDPTSNDKPTSVDFDQHMFIEFLDGKDVPFKSYRLNNPVDNTRHEVSFTKNARRIRLNNIPGLDGKKVVVSAGPKIDGVRTLYVHDAAEYDKDNARLGEYVFAIGEDGELSLIFERKRFVGKKFNLNQEYLVEQLALSGSKYEEIIYAALSDLLDFMINNANVTEFNTSILDLILNKIRFLSDDAKFYIAQSISRFEFYLPEYHAAEKQAEKVRTAVKKIMQSASSPKLEKEIGWRRRFQRLLKNVVLPPRLYREADIALKVPTGTYQRTLNEKLFPSERIKFYSDVFKKNVRKYARTAFGMTDEEFQASDAFFHFIKFDTETFVQNYSLESYQMLLYLPNELFHGQKESTYQKTIDTDAFLKLWTIKILFGDRQEIMKNIEKDLFDPLPQNIEEKFPGPDLRRRAKAILDAIIEKYPDATRNYFDNPEKIQKLEKSEIGRWFLNTLNLANKSKLMKEGIDVKDIRGSERFVSNTAGGEVEDDFDYEKDDANDTDDFDAEKQTSRSEQRQPLNMTVRFGAEFYNQIKDMPESLRSFILDGIYNKLTGIQHLDSGTMPGTPLRKIVGDSEINFSELKTSKYRIIFSYDYVSKYQQNDPRHRQITFYLFWIRRDSSTGKADELNYAAIEAYGKGIVEDDARTLEIEKWFYGEKQNAMTDDDFRAFLAVLVRTALSPMQIASSVTQLTEIIRGWKDVPGYEIQKYLRKIQEIVAAKAGNGTAYFEEAAREWLRNLGMVTGEGLEAAKEIFKQWFAIEYHLLEIALLAVRNGAAADFVDVAKGVGVLYFEIAGPEFKIKIRKEIEKWAHGLPKTKESLDLLKTAGRMIQSINRFYKNETSFDTKVIDEKIKEVERGLAEMGNIQEFLASSDAVDPAAPLRISRNDGTFSSHPETRSSPQVLGMDSAASPRSAQNDKKPQPKEHFRFPETENSLHEAKSIRNELFPELTPEQVLTIVSVPVDPDYPSKDKQLKRIREILNGQSEETKAHAEKVFNEIKLVALYFAKAFLEPVRYRGLFENVLERVDIMFQADKRDSEEMFSRGEFLLRLVLYDQEGTIKNDPAIKDLYETAEKMLSQIKSLREWFSDFFRGPSTLFEVRNLIERWDKMTAFQRIIVYHIFQVNESLPPEILKINEQIEIFKALKDKRKDDLILHTAAIMMLPYFWKMDLETSVKRKALKKIPLTKSEEVTKRLRKPTKDYSKKHLELARAILEAAETCQLGDKIRSATDLVQNVTYRGDGDQTRSEDRSDKNRLNVTPDFKLIEPVVFVLERNIIDRWRSDDKDRILNWLFGFATVNKGVFHLVVPDVKSGDEWEWLGDLKKTASVYNDLRAVGNISKMPVFCFSSVMFEPSREFFERLDRLHSRPSSEQTTLVDLDKGKGLVLAATLGKKIEELPTENGYHKDVAGRYSVRISQAIETFLQAYKVIAASA